MNFFNNSIMRVSTMFASLLAIAIACGGESEVDSLSDTTEVESVEEDWAFATWETCSSNLNDHPCNFTLEDQDGDDWSLYDHHEKVIVIDFSAIWCSVCRNIASKGDEFTQLYGEDNFIWATALLDGSTYGEPPSESEIQAWVEDYAISGPVLAGSREMISSDPVEGWPVSSWPTLVVIDADMVLVYGSHGWNEATMKEQVENALN